MSERVLVIGGAGMLGAPVVTALLRRDYSVRVLSRRRPETLTSGVEHVAASALDLDALSAAAEGCCAIHVNLRGRSIEEARETEVGGARAAATVAAARGIRLTYLSGAGLGAAPPDNPFARMKLDAEEAIKAAGANYTLFRASHFMESLDAYMRGRNAVILGRQTNRYRYIAASDYADMVARSIKTPEAAGKTLDILGPQAFTMAEALAIFTRALHPGAKVSTLPFPIAKLVSGISGNRELRHAIMLFESFAKMPEIADSAPADALFGPAPTTLRAWCENRRAASAT